MMMDIDGPAANGLFSEQAMRSLWMPGELRRSPAAQCFSALYRFSPLRRYCARAILLLENGPFFSESIRRVLWRYHGVAVGAYSYGECLNGGAFPRGVVVGRYVSMASGVRVFLRDHPMDRLSTHPFFFNRELGIVEADTVEMGSLQIGHDAWIGDRVIITPGCRRVGVGAVIGAGAVVTRDVPDFAVVAGNPARLIRMRFPERTCRIILESRWWEHPLHVVRRHLADMTRPLGDDPWLHPLLAEKGRATL